MTRVRIPYGKREIAVDIPDKNLLGIVEPGRAPHIEDVSTATQLALDSPLSSNRLSKVVRPNDKVVIAATDLTRPCPDHLVIPLILNELNTGGVPDGRISIVIGLGLHRSMDDREIIHKFGAEVARRVKILNHDPVTRERLVDLGASSRGSPMVVNKSVAEADFLISTGIVEPHVYAGYSGGRKTIAIGCAGEETIGYLHSTKILDDPGTRLGAIKSNVFHETATEIALKTGLDFIVNIVSLGEMETIGVLAGKPIEAFAQAVKLADKTFKVEVPEPADIVIAGVKWPKSTNLYQASRGASNTLFVPKPIVKEGGVVITPAPCEEGVGLGIGERRFYETFSSAETLDDVIQEGRTRGFPPGAHRAYVLAKALKQADLIIVGSKIRNRVEEMHMKAARDMSEAMRMAFEKCGRDATLLVVPDSLHTLPGACATSPRKPDP